MIITAGILLAITMGQFELHCDHHQGLGATVSTQLSLLCSESSCWEQMVTTILLKYPAGGAWLPLTGGCYIVYLICRYTGHGSGLAWAGNCTYLSVAVLYSNDRQTQDVKHFTKYLDISNRSLERHQINKM